MRFRNVDIELSSTGKGTIIVDGTDIAESVVDFWLSSGVGQQAHITLSLVVRKSTRFVGSAHVGLSDQTAALLESLGWTPPAASDPA